MQADHRRRHHHSTRADSWQDAKARATRSAMLIEYAYRHEFSKLGTSGEGKYDMVLSA